LTYNSVYDCYTSDLAWDFHSKIIKSVKQYVFNCQGIVLDEVLIVSAFATSFLDKEPESVKADSDIHLKIVKKGDKHVGLVFFGEMIEET